MIGASIQTRNESYWSLRDSGRLTERQEQVMRVINAHPGRDWTNNEIADALGWTINKVTPRTGELRGMCKLEHGEKRFCTVEPGERTVTTVRLPRGQKELF